MAEPYQKGDLEIANAALSTAQQNYRRAESALAVAQAELTKAERHSADRFNALIKLSEAKVVADTRRTDSAGCQPPAVFSDQTSSLEER